MALRNGQAYRKSCERKQFAEPKRIRSWDLPLAEEETGLREEVLREASLYSKTQAPSWMIAKERNIGGSAHYES